MGIPAMISVVVEGIVDEAVASKLIELVGATVGPVYGKNGKTWVRQKVRSYGEAARYAPWLVIVDLDQDHQCAPQLVQEWLPNQPPQLCFRVAVRAIESWLLADGESLAEFLGIARKRVPKNPEALSNPKEAMINLARACRRRELRDDMLPRPGSDRAVGPAYASRMIEFASNYWVPTQAANNAESLGRAVNCLARLARPPQDA